MTGSDWEQGGDPYANGRRLTGAEAAARAAGQETAQRNVTPIVAFALEDGRRRFRIHAQHSGDLLATFTTGPELGEFWDAFGIERERAAAKAAETAPGTDLHRLALNAEREGKCEDT